RPRGGRCTGGLGTAAPRSSRAADRGPEAPRHGGSSLRRRLRAAARRAALCDPAGRDGGEPRRPRRAAGGDGRDGGRAPGRTRQLVLRDPGRPGGHPEERTPGWPAGAGDFFGEIALLRGTVRNATVMATTQLDLLVVQRDEFMAAIAHPRTRHGLDAVATQRAEPAGPPLS